MSEEKQIHPSGLNIIENEDGSFALEWDANDTRWSWLNGLTDDKIKSIIEEAIEKQILLEDVSNALDSIPEIRSNGL
jgi:hypothetical protein